MVQVVMAPEKTGVCMSSKKCYEKKSLLHSFFYLILECYYVPAKFLSNADIIVN